MFSPTFFLSRCCCDPVTVDYQAFWNGNDLDINASIDQTVLSNRPLHTCMDINEHFGDYPISSTFPELLMTKPVFTKQGTSRYRICRLSTDHSPLLYCVSSTSLETEAFHSQNNFSNCLKTSKFFSMGCHSKMNCDIDMKPKPLWWSSEHQIFRLLNKLINIETLKYF